MDRKLLLQKLITVRRNLHQIPETGMDLPRTAAYLTSILEEAGLQVKRLAGGLVVQIGEGPCRVLLRADMDALPIYDIKNVPYASTIAGNCHACGHDGHMAMLYGAILILKENIHHLHGSVRIVFQPSEEMPPGGALGMIEEGVLEGIQVAFALHLSPYLPFGKVGIKPGETMASTDNIRMEITGKGGHAAMPHHTVDAVVIAAHLILALQNVASRMISPMEPFVLTIGRINGGEADNIIAGKVKLEGTVRTIRHKTRENIPEKIRRIAEGICNAYGAGLQFNYEHGYPVLRNDEGTCETIVTHLRQVGWENNLMFLHKASMGAEDFAYILEKVPGCFMFLGTKANGYEYPLHHPGFDFHEDILPLGAALLAQLARFYLSNEKKACFST